MPRLLKLDKTPADEVVITHVWFEIPLGKNEYDTVLINPKLLIYLEKLEAAVDKETLKTIHI